MVIFHGYVSHNQMVTLINGSSTMERYRHGSMVSFFSGCQAMEALLGEHYDVLREMLRLVLEVRKRVAE